MQLNINSAIFFLSFYIFHPIDVSQFDHPVPRWISMLPVLHYHKQCWLPWWLSGKELACNAGDTGLILYHFTLYPQSSFPLIIISTLMISDFPHVAILILISQCYFNFHFSNYLQSWKSLNVFKFPLVLIQVFPSVNYSFPFAIFLLDLLFFTYWSFISLEHYEYILLICHLPVNLV